MKSKKIHQLAMHLLRKVVKYCQYKNGYSKINCNFTVAVTSYVQ